MALVVEAQLTPTSGDELVLNGLAFKLTHDPQNLTPR